MARLTKLALLALGPKASLSEMCELVKIRDPQRLTGATPELPTTCELLRIADLTGC